MKPTIEALWRTWDTMEARLSAPLSARMLELARLRPGMRVLDLATGRGEPAIAAAHRVGPEGEVLGIDADEGVLTMARERAAREGLTNLELRVADAAVPGVLRPAHFHATLVRWGLMYLADPVAALTAARTAMVPGGLLVAAVWAEPERVPYFSLPRLVLQPHRPVPALDPEAPGTFFYADSERLRRDLQLAGLEVVSSEEMDVTVMEARTDRELIEWCRAFGLNTLLHGVPEATQRHWEEDLVRAVVGHRRDGVVTLGGVTRLVVASDRTTPGPPLSEPA